MKTLLLILLLCSISCKKEDYNPLLHGDKITQKSVQEEKVEELLVFGVSCDQYYLNLSEELDELVAETSKEKVLELTKKIKKDKSKKNIKKIQKHKKFNADVFKVSISLDEPLEISYPSLEKKVNLLLENGNMTDISVKTEKSQIQLEFKGNKDTIIIKDNLLLKNELYKLLAPECPLKAKAKVVETKTN